MAKKRGKRAYFQLLLGEHRALLLEELAAESDMKVMPFMRELIYGSLKKLVPKSEYQQAEAADQAVWMESVRNRVQGRG